MMEVKKQTYYDSDCKEKHCTLCSVPSIIHFILRGLPKQYSKINNSDNGIDSHYVHVPSEQQTQSGFESLSLRGYFDHRIQLNKSRENGDDWEIMWSSQSTDRVGIVNVYHNKLPLGRREWKLNRRGYPDQQEEISLKLSMVNFELIKNKINKIIY